MPTVTSPDRGQTEAIEWSVVTGIQQIVFVARIDRTPIAILEVMPNKTCRLTTCRGHRLGTFGSVEEAQSGLRDWLVENPAGIHS